MPRAAAPAASCRSSWGAPALPQPACCLLPALVPSLSPPLRSYTFPSRPLNNVNMLAINQLTGVRDIDFDGDEIQLQDFWQETIPVSATASGLCPDPRGSPP